MPSDEGNEPRRRDRPTLEHLATSKDEREHLRVSLSERGQETPAFGQLPKQRLGHIR